jgi:hypothetical protein
VRYAGLDQRGCARRRAAGVAAWLERDIGRCAPSRLTGRFEREGFGVALTGTRVKPLPHDETVAHHDAAYEGIGRRHPSTALGELGGSAQERVGNRGRDIGKQAQTQEPSSTIRTLTVGPGISPDRPLSGFAGCHRRWGFSPRPEESDWRVAGGWEGRTAAVSPSGATAEPGPPRRATIASSSRRWSLRNRRILPTAQMGGGGRGMARCRCQPGARVPGDTLRSGVVSSRRPPERSGRSCAPSCGDRDPRPPSP